MLLLAHLIFFLARKGKCQRNALGFFFLHSVCRTVILGLKNIVQEEFGYAKLQSQFGVIGKTETAENKTWSPTQGVVKFSIKTCNMFLQQITRRSLLSGCIAVWTDQDFSTKSALNYKMDFELLSFTIAPLIYSKHRN